MICKKCGSPMEPFRKVTHQQQLITTTWLCLRCLNRTESADKNPRRQEIPQPSEPTENKRPYMGAAIPVVKATGRPITQDEIDQAQGNGQ